jgi:hypothetical protein
MSANPEETNSGSLRRTRKTASVSEGLDRRLGAYALVACASGVSIAALAQQTPHSTIIYRPVSINFWGSVRGSSSPLQLDLNDDGVTDFTISAGGSGYSLGTEGVSYYQAIAFWGAAEGNGGAYDALDKGMYIGPDRKFIGGTLLLHSRWEHRHRGSYGHAKCWGPFGAPSNSPKNAYLGVKFLVGSETHYGWIRLTTSCDTPGTVEGTVTGYAYETLPDTPIAAGQIYSGTDEEKETEKPATLGMLGLGSAGLPLWRK